MLIPLFNMPTGPCQWHELSAAELQGVNDLLTLRGAHAADAALPQIAQKLRPADAPSMEEALAAGIPLGRPTYLRGGSEEILSFGLALAARLLSVQTTQARLQAQPSPGGNPEALLKLSMTREIGRATVLSQLHVQLLQRLSDTPQPRGEISGALHQLSEQAARTWHAGRETPHSWMSASGCLVGTEIPGMRGQLRRALEALSSRLQANLAGQLKLDSLSSEQVIYAETDHVIAHSQYDEDEGTVGFDIKPWHGVPNLDPHPMDQPGLYPYYYDDRLSPKQQRRNLVFTLRETPLLSRVAQTALHDSPRVRRRLSHTDARRLTRDLGPADLDPTPEALLSGAGWRP